MPRTNINKPRNENNIKSVEVAVDNESSNLKTCSLLYPELMKTKCATIEQQEKDEQVEEIAEIFEGVDEIFTFYINMYKLSNFNGVKFKCMFCEISFVFEFQPIHIFFSLFYGG